MSIYASRIPYCDCPQCNAEDEPEADPAEMAELRTEIARSVDFISEIAPNESESLGIASALSAGDDAAIGRIVRAALARSLDEHVEAYMNRSWASEEQALQALHHLYVEAA